MERIKRKASHLVVGIDFGTTYSGVAYCLTSNPAIDNIKVITQWPSSIIRNEEKVPSEICFVSSDEGEGDDVLWGYKAIAKGFPRQKDVPIYGRFKLLLDPHSGRTRISASNRGEVTDAGNRNATINIPPGTTALGLTTDYLRCVYKHIMPLLRTKLPPRVSTEPDKDPFDTTPIEFVATIPAIWKPGGQSATRKAFEAAGFGVQRGQVTDTLTLIAEPEAAALYALRDIYREGESVGDRVMIIDAGGGTVDVTTYCVDAPPPVLKLGEAVSGIGNHCGSSFVDDNIHRLLQTKIGPSYSDAKVWTPQKKGRGSAFAADIDQIKRSYEPSHRSSWIELPIEVVDNKDAGILNNSVELTNLEIAGCFDLVVSDVLKLAEQQLGRLRKEGKATKLKNIVLVGGFGESRHLLKKITEWASKQSSELRVISPSHPWSAVARGAVLSALNKHTVQRRKLRMHYGVGMSVPFVAGLHDESRAIIDPFGVKQFSDGVNWLAAMGNDVTATTSISIPAGFVREEDEILDNCTVHIFGCAYDDPPHDIKDNRVEDLGSLVIPVMDLPPSRLKKQERRGIVYYICEMKIEMKFGSAEALFSVIYGNQKFGNYKLRHAGLPS